MATSVQKVLSAVPMKGVAPPKAGCHFLFCGEWMRSTLDTIDQLAVSDVPVVFQGGTGVGKAHAGPLAGSE